MERTNIRNVTAEMFEFKPQLAVVDVSFISLKLVLPVLKEILSNDGQAICLIKPQFEAGREKVGKNGVVRDAETKINVLDEFIQNAEQVGFRVNGLTYSPIKGPKGNIEFLCSLGYYSESAQINTRTVVMDGQEELGD
jgi:23S rRNA (cytidine1920-2'-O)/16S rRNA (cytidine1409-2'-O)-methyltransferase